MQINRHANARGAVRATGEAPRRRSVLRRLRDRLDALFAAVTFAEAGEFEVARRLADESRKTSELRG
jgi:hypothetical protein